MSVLDKLFRKFVTEEAITDLIMLMSGMMIGAFVKALFNSVSIL